MSKKTVINCDHCHSPADADYGDYDHRFWFKIEILPGKHVEMRKDGPFSSGKISYFPPAPVEPGVYDFCCFNCLNMWAATKAAQLRQRIAKDNP